MKNSKFINYMLTTGRIDNITYDYYKFRIGTEVDKTDIKLDKIYNKYSKILNSFVLLCNIAGSFIIKEDGYDKWLQFDEFVTSLFELFTDKDFYEDIIDEVACSEDDDKLCFVEYYAGGFGKEVNINGKILYIDVINHRGLMRLKDRNGKEVYRDIYIIEKDIKTGHVTLLEKTGIPRLERDARRYKEGKIKVIAMKL